MSRTKDPGKRQASEAIASHYSTLAMILNRPGRSSFFEGNPCREFLNGTICYSPETGPRILRGHILQFWRDEDGFKVTGYPVTDQAPGPDGKGQICYFENGRVQSNAGPPTFDQGERTHRIKLHVKLLWPVSLFDLAMRTALAQYVLGASGVLMELESVEHLEHHRLFKNFRSLDQDKELDSLLATRERLPATDIVLFFVRQMSSGSEGNVISKDPPTALVASTAPLWTLAHEIGHLLGLDDVPPESPAAAMRLMFHGISHHSVNPPPYLSTKEIGTIRSRR